MSGIGKGITASSIGALLKSSGLKVTAIKIDPYLNIDAGLMSPYEHGEVFVLGDGGEVDLDLGNYERFLDIDLDRDNNLTTGKLHHKIIQDERQGLYQGKTVQIVPHFTDAVQKWITTTAEKSNSDIAIVEVGGTVGDIESMPFLEAMREFRNDVGRDNLICVQVSPLLSSSGEPKTKPMQHSVIELRARGLEASIVVCRGNGFNQKVASKISNFTGVPHKHIFHLEDLKSIYLVPIELESQGMRKSISELLNLNLERNGLNKWREISEIAINSTKEIPIALVGKYTDFEDCYTSVIRALQHACYSIGAKPNLKLIASGKLEDNDEEAWSTLKSTECLIVPGGFDKRGTEGKILAIRWARESKFPFLGICLGFQLAVIEYARNVIGIKDATTEEFDADGVHFIIEMLEYIDPQRKMGGTMRLGVRNTILVGDNSLAKDLYGGSSSVAERHRHRYEVNPVHTQALEDAGLRFVGKNEDGTRMEILELDRKEHPFFLGVQYHPEFLTRPFRPSPPYVGLIKAAEERLIKKGKL